MRKDGELVWCQLTAVLERDRDGRPSVVTTMIENISDRKDSESQLRQAQKMDAVGQLSAGIAHDFNNLLMGVLGYAGIARGEVETDSRAAECLGKIEESAQVAAALTRQLLAFGRRQTLQMRAIDLNALVAETVSLLSRVVGEQVELVPVLAPSLRRVQSDASQIEQAAVRAVLHDEGSRQRHRTRPTERLRHRQAEPRRHRSNQRAGRRGNVPHLLAGERHVGGDRRRSALHRASAEGSGVVR